MSDLLITGQASSVFQDLKSATGVVRSQSVQQTATEARTATVVSGKVSDAAVAQFSSSQRAPSHGEGRKADASYEGERSKGKSKGSSTERQTSRSAISVKA